MKVSKFPYKPASKDSRGSCPRMVVISWLLILFWLALLVGAWQMGLITNPHLSESTAPIITSSSSLDNTRRIDRIEDKSSMLRSESNHVATIEEKEDIHVIFSTDCTPFQDWQTIVLFHSARTVGQKGSITRIASGCDDDKKKELTALYAKLYPDYRVHFTPDFKKDEKTGRKCRCLCLYGYAT
jgi:hypothetical protein